MRPLLCAIGEFRDLVVCPPPFKGGHVVHLPTHGPCWDVNGDRRNGGMGIIPRVWPDRPLAQRNEHGGTLDKGDVDRHCGKLAGDIDACVGRGFDGYILFDGDGYRWPGALGALWLARTILTIKSARPQATVLLYDDETQPGMTPTGCPSYGLFNRGSFAPNPNFDTGPVAARAYIASQRARFGPHARVVPVVHDRYHNLPGKPALTDLDLSLIITACYGQEAIVWVEGTTEASAAQASAFVARLATALMPLKPIVRLEARGGPAA